MGEDPTTMFVCMYVCMYVHNLVVEGREGRRGVSMYIYSLYRECMYVGI